MRAMAYASYGGTEKLTLTDVPRTTPGPAQILVRVIASSVNPIDWKRASGAYRLVMPVSFPAVPGCDIAGVVAEVGPGVTELEVGARVHACIGDGGAAAEFAVADVGVTARVPASMDPGEAAGLPLAGMTALQGLRDRARLPLTGAHERVLVAGASGGVGHLAVQIARASGATVVGVCSGRNAELVMSLGAHEVIDYTQPDPYRGRAPFDVVLDCVAGDPSPWLPLLGAGGRYVCTTPTGKTFLRSAINQVASRKVRPVFLKRRAEDLQSLDRLVEQGKLRVAIDKRFKLEELPRAWERSRSGRTAGKIVIDVG